MVTLEYKDGVIFACYIKDMDFIAIVKKLNYKWDGALWRRKITEYTGNATERAAELGNKLLLAGYTVCFFNEISKDMAVSGTFEPENDRWVKCFDGELAITWRGRNDKLFKLAKKLPGAKWKDGSMMVSVEFYSEVEDFAETMGFAISNAAKERIKEYKQKKLPGAKWKDGSMMVSVEFYSEVEDFAETMGFAISNAAKERIKEYKQKENTFEIATISVKNQEVLSDEEKIKKTLKSNGTIIEDLIDE